MVDEHGKRWESGLRYNWSYWTVRLPPATTRPRRQLAIRAQCRTGIGG